MDGNGRWCNADGRFRHKKIIDHFHSAIAKDEGGYFVRQERADLVEKVYFRYDETALFVFEVIIGENLVLGLNTGRRVELQPEGLYVKGDALFMRLNDEIIKFTDRTMMKLAGYIEEKEGRLYFSWNGQCHLMGQK